MDSTTKRRLFLGFLSNWIGKLASTIIQLIQVPVFLHFWSVPLYGEWLIVSSIPSTLSFANVGFGSVAGNEMAMAESAGNREAALRSFQSSWWLICGICTVTILIGAAVLYLFPVARHLHLNAIGETDTKWVIFYLGISVLLGQLEQLLQAAYRSIGRYPFGGLVKTVMTLGAFAAMLVPVILGGGVRSVALVFALANALGTLILSVMVKRDVPWIVFGFEYASWAEIRRITGPALAFMGFPIGNALNLQGTLMAVGYALGPTAVVIFGTARTVSRVALQMVQMVNSTFEPELALSFGAGDIPLVRSLHRRACQLALIVAVVVVLSMITIGPWFLHHWTAGHVPPSRPLLAILLLVVIAYALWSTSSVLITSTNQHQRLAAWYIAGTSVTVCVTYLAARHAGLYAAAWSLLISEAVMNLYVLPTSLRLAQDHLPAFLAGLTEYPPSLRPAFLLARLRRSKPGLES